MKYRSSIRNRTLETEPHSSNRVCHNSRSRVPLRALQAVQIFTSVTTGCIRNTSIKRRDEKVLYIFGLKVGIVKEERFFSIREEMVREQLSAVGQRQFHDPRRLYV